MRTSVHVASKVIFLLLRILCSLAVSFEPKTCDCGFRDMQDPTGKVWTTYWESDFTKMNAQDLTSKFRYMVQPVQHSSAVRYFKSSNVAIDTGGLHLTVQPPDVNGNVLSGGIYTQSQDFGFGVYHFEARLTNVAGTVQAFYLYKNDTNEIDIEHLNEDGSNPFVRFSVKPEEYLATGLVSNQTNQQGRPRFDLSAKFHRYSLVWNSSAISYAIDANWSATITTNIPHSPGVLSLSHWSDGDPDFSGGPPTSQATVTVSRAWAYYNATGVTLACQTFAAPCKLSAASPGFYFSPSNLALLALISALVLLFVL